MTKDIENIMLSEKEMVKQEKNIESIRYFLIVLGIFLYILFACVFIVYPLPLEVILYTIGFVVGGIISISYIYYIERYIRKIHNIIRQSKNKPIKKNKDTTIIDRELIKRVEDLLNQPLDDISCVIYIAIYNLVFIFYAQYVLEGERKTQDIIRHLKNKK